MFSNRVTLHIFVDNGHIHVPSKPRFFPDFFGVTAIVYITVYNTQSGKNLYMQWDLPITVGIQLGGGMMYM